jgi:hypothetical protein
MWRSLKAFTATNPLAAQPRRAPTPLMKSGLFSNSVLTAYTFFFCCRVRSRTPGPPPFSSMNSTPAASSAS